MAPLFGGGTSTEGFLCSCIIHIILEIFWPVLLSKTALIRRYWGDHLDQIGLFSSCHPVSSWVKIKRSTQPFSNAKFLWLQPFCGKCIRAFRIAAMLSFNLWTGTLIFSSKIFWYNPESYYSPKGEDHPDSEAAKQPQVRCSHTLLYHRKDSFFC